MKSHHNLLIFCSLLKDSVYNMLTLDELTEIRVQFNAVDKNKGKSQKSILY